ncbi:hypothetical protein LIER_02350 [Lithospermum erythrorhizon]|uniref:Uncharacterized protein n=1 Tax=Lithospermum erythrorhizon TaxID=34254 RepID=A0AAV3NP59_LITER
MGADTPPSPEEHSSPSPPPRDQCQDPPPLANPALVVAQENTSGQYSATVILEPEYQGGAHLPLPPGSSLRPRKRLGSPLAISRPSQFPRRSEWVPPSSSSTAPNHTKLISSISTLGDKGMALQFYKDLLSSYEAARGSSYRASQLEGELKVLKDEKTREAKALQRRLKTLAGEHSILQERYEANVRRTEAVKASLEGVQAERDSAVKERDAVVREWDILRAGRDEIL